MRDDVPADFAPFAGSGPSATIEALRALANRPRAALPGLAKDGPATVAKNRTDAPRRGSFGFTNSRSDPIVRSRLRWPSATHDSPRSRAPRNQAASSPQV